MVTKREIKHFNERLANLDAGRAHRGTEARVLAHARELWPDVATLDDAGEARRFHETPGARVGAGMSRHVPSSTTR